MLPTTVNAKKAFSPIPGASARGMRAISPIAMVPSPATRQVANAAATGGMPAAERIAGLTAMM